MRYHADWITPADLKFYKAAKGKVFEVLAKRAGEFVPVALIERASGTLRVAARIDSIRDDWDVETKRGADNRAMYQLKGRQTGRIVRSHCKTCQCDPERETRVHEGQQEMKL
jgi:hypothetical protein